jgi:predicted HTH transcriptional regulator
MNKIDKLISELCPDGVEFKELWEFTAWDKMFNGWKSYYKIEPIVENEITFYKIEFPLITKWDNIPNKHRADIIALIQNNNKLTISEIYSQLKINENIIKKDIAILKQEGRIKRIMINKESLINLSKNQRLITPKANFREDKDAC